MSKAPKDALDALHGALAQALAQRIASGEATAADMAVARQFLKDNGIDAEVREGSPLSNLAKSLPFASPEDIVRDGETLQ